MKAGQSDVIGFLLLTLVAIAVISVTYLWAMPLFDQSRNLAEVSRLENRMLELHNAIKKVANEQTRQTIPFSIETGTLVLDENNETLIFQAYLDLPERSMKARPIIGKGNDTNITTLMNTNIGKLGTDEPAYLIEKGSIRFELHYLLLNDTATGDCYGIDLRQEAGKPAAAGDGDHTIFVKWVSEDRNYNYTGCKNITRQLVSIGVE